MSTLNRDVLYLIFKELKDDINTLYSCLLVDKIWFMTIISILWKNPWKFLNLKQKKLQFLNLIISHLSDELKNNLIQDGDYFFTNSYQKPLLNYINFCKHLNFNMIIDIINSAYSNSDKLSIIENEIFKLFINENTKFTHLYILNQFDYQIHLIPGVECCFSKLKVLRCGFNMNQNILEGLAKICKSIEKLEFKPSDNIGIIKLIDVQKNLIDVHLFNNISFYQPVEESLIKHVNTIQYLKIDLVSITKKLLIHFVNLISLEINSFRNENWNHLESVSLPHLKFLKAREISSNNLASLIENTNGHLTEISICSLFINDVDNKRLIQIICKHCPNLKYLMLLFKNRDILEIEKLLINCQYLDGLIINVDRCEKEFDWKKLFEILTRSSPPSLFKFKFYIHRYRTSKFESLKFFFDNWSGRHPILLQTVHRFIMLREYIDVIQKYKKEGIVRKYDNVANGNTFDEFEWIKKKI
ncbi:hypothetical protein C1645_873039 [Glomus cerebriforme]|uniref:F-box domain-containing protein n=1 Tax=Glomus cerebriforme TaxID=658196 RepID=A0A397TA00_9GLOM|nr:hypothetical protein C1645_873039 [Glomus cerebriforme]